MSSPRHHRSLRLVQTDQTPGGVSATGLVPHGYSRAEYEAIVVEMSQRIARTHAHMCSDHREVLPVGMARDRPLAQDELRDLAWRAYLLSGVTGYDLIRCRPELVIAAWEWHRSPEQDAYESLFAPPPNSADYST